MRTLSVAIATALPLLSWVACGDPAAQLEQALGSGANVVKAEPVQDSTAWLPLNSLPLDVHQSVLSGDVTFRCRSGVPRGTPVVYPLFYDVGGNWRSMGDTVELALTYHVVGDVDNTESYDPPYRIEERIGVDTVRITGVNNGNTQWDYHCPGLTRIYLPKSGEENDPGAYQNRLEFLRLVSVADSILGLRRELNDTSGN